MNSWGYIFIITLLTGGALMAVIAWLKERDCRNVLGNSVNELAKSQSKLANAKKALADDKDFKETTTRIKMEAERMAREIENASNLTDYLSGKRDSK